MKKNKIDICCEFRKRLSSVFEKDRKRILKNGNSEMYLKLNKYYEELVWGDIDKWEEEQVSNKVLQEDEIMKTVAEIIREIIK